MPARSRTCAVYFLRDISIPHNVSYSHSFGCAHSSGMRPRCASEAVALRWDQVDLEAGLLLVVRIKNGAPSTHPLRGVELRARPIGLRTSFATDTFEFARQSPLVSRRADVTALLGAASKSTAVKKNESFSFS